MSADAYRQQLRYLLSMGAIKETWVDYATANVDALDALERVQRDADDVPEAQLASWVRRAETAERERDELRADLSSLHARNNENCRDKDAARAALAKILAVTSLAARCPHEDAHEIAAVALVDIALASATPAEGDSHA